MSQERQFARDHYGAWRQFGKMQGENPELLKLAMAVGCYVEITLSWAKKPLYGTVSQFNEFTGRVFLRVGRDSASITRNFLLQEVKMFGFPTELHLEWERSKAGR